MNKYRKIVKEKNKYREFLRVINGNLHLTDREIDILSLFLRLDIEWKSIFEGDFKNLNSTDNRKSVIKHSMIRRSNLTTLMKRFKSKGILLESEEGGTYVNPLLIPVDRGDLLQILFEVQVEPKD